MIVFLIHVKTEVDRRIKSYGDIRKYKGAIFWGATARQRTTADILYTNIEAYMKEYKRLLGTNSPFLVIRIETLRCLSY